MIADDLLKALDALPLVDLDVTHDPIQGYKATLWGGVDRDDYNEFGEGAGTTVAEAIEGALTDLRCARNAR